MKNELKKEATEKITIFCDSAYEKTNHVLLILFMTMEFVCGYFAAKDLIIEKNKISVLSAFMAAGFLFACLLLLSGGYHKTVYLKAKHQFQKDNNNRELSFTDSITNVSYFVSDFKLDAFINKNDINEQSILITADKYFESPGGSSSNKVPRHNGKWEFVMIKDDALRFLEFMDINAEELLNNFLKENDIDEKK